MLQPLIILLLIGIQISLAKDVMDITTIYHVGDVYRNNTASKQVEVHLHTNARGLPYNFGDKYFDDFIEGRHFPSCQYESINKESNICPWTTEGWTLKYTPKNASSSKNPFFLRGSFSPIQPIKTTTLGVKLRGYFKGRIDVVLLPLQTTLIRKLSDFYLVRFNWNFQTYYSYLYYCQISRYGNNQFIDIDGQDFTKECTEITGSSNSNWKLDGHNSTNIFVLDVSHGRLQIWDNLDQTNKIIDWQPTSSYPPIIAKYFSMYMSNSYGMEATLLTQGLHKNSSNPLISPWFSADMDELCLTVVADFFGVGQINITAENVVQETYQLLQKSYNYAPFEDNIKVLHLTSQLPDHLKGSKIRLIVSIDTNFFDFKIYRISSCNSQGGDVAVLSLNEVQSLKTEHEKYEANIDDDRSDGDLLRLEEVQTIDEKIQLAFDVEYLKAEKGLKCPKFLYPGLYHTSNGGCKDGLSVACPPGFSGPQCETACGRNSFGRDCKGICSLYSLECKGVRLCTPSLGCQCAPGYLGENCEENCEAGTYGNDCDQYCGKCEYQNACDIYTGHCETCVPGYYPPYCKDTYPVVLHAPNVSTPTFGQAEIQPIKLDEYSGRGTPFMYQIQYREASKNNWTIRDSFYYNDLFTVNEETDQNSSAAVTVIQGLDHGKLYEVRIILFDNNLNSFTNGLVPVRRFLTLCTIPDKVDYHITSMYNTTAMSIYWDYKNTSAYWCPMLRYEVSRKENWKWITENTSEPTFSLSNLLPGKRVIFKVRASTSRGFAPYSKTIFVSTKLVVPGPVKHLSSQHKDNFELITWDCPENIGTEIMEYHLKYQCFGRIGCTLGCDSNGTVELVVSNTNATLYSLLPFTQYLVTVSAGNGPTRSIVIGTKMAVPTEIVKHSSLPPVRTNNSVTLFWEPVEVCSGFFKGYIYKLNKADDSQIVASGSTIEPHVTIHGLVAKTEYAAQVFIETVAGWDENKYLLTTISTSATVPEQVENLTVYKRGRNLLGLRWGKPKKLYGTLKSFTIVYGFGGNVNTTKVSPTPCIVWPNMYCHTLENLLANRKYNVTVSATNTEVSEDGRPSTVIEITKEGMAGVPENVEVVNKTSTSFAISWKYPSMASGIIRSFLMSVEETEQYETEKCCQIYPLMETIVKQEQYNYILEVSGLHPASTYTISLSAKTVSFGPSVTLTIYTSPPSMPLQYLPKVTVKSEDNWTWLPQNSMESLNNSEIYQPLIKGNILLVVLDSISEDYVTGIEHDQLITELKKVIKSDFYLAAEYFKGDSIVIGTEDSEQTKWGKVNKQNLNQGHTYSLAAVQISEYCGVYNVDVVFSTTFTAAII